MPPTQQNLFLCLSCASVFRAAESDPVVCPDCSFAISRGDYLDKIGFGKQIATLGVQSRRIYEQDLAEFGNLPRRYSLRIDDLLTFATLAVASGIIGNATYDLVKHILRKIKTSFENTEQSSQTIEHGERQLFFTLLSDDAEFDRFREEVSEYLNGSKNVEPIVRSAIGVYESRRPKDQLSGLWHRASEDAESVDESE